MKMDNKARKITGTIAGSMLLLTALPLAPAGAAPEVDGAGVAQDTIVEAGENTNVAIADCAVKVADIQGLFTSDQGVSTSNADLRRALYKGSAYLCGSQAADTAAAVHTAGITNILVTGDVSNSFSASIAGYEKDAPARAIMGCTCGGNLVDGRASANAQVEGFELAALIADAVPDADVNTITFISQDGLTTSLPLSYVEQRYCIIVTYVNGEAAGQAVGCSNQLWLGATSARYYAQNITEIRLTHEQDPPLAPGAQPQANQPNVGITSSEVG